MGTIGEKSGGWLFDVQRYSLKNGPGIRTTLFLKGCPLRCWWCSNPESQAFAPELMFHHRLCTACGACTAACPQGLSPQNQLHRPRCQSCMRCAQACLSGALEVCGRWATVEEALEPALRDRCYCDFSGGGLTLSGGECLCQASFALALLQGAKHAGLHTAVDTCLHVPTQDLLQAAEWTDLFLADIKHMDPDRHRQGVGADNALILHNLAALLDAGAAVWIRIPLIKGFNDDAKNARALAAFLRGHPPPERIELLPGHGIGVGKYASLGRGTCPPAPPDAQTMAEIQGILEKSGVFVRMESI